MNRGNRRSRIFRDDEDALEFLGSLARTVETHGIEVHAYSLMPNHYHLLVRSVLGNLSEAMKVFGGSYTQRVNRRHGWEGSVFRGRYSNQPVTHAPYLVYLVAYIHLNPLRAGLVTRVDAEFAWTSHRAYLGKDRPPSWLCTRPVLRLCGSRRKFGKLVLGLHRGAIEWPDNLDLGSGFFDRYRVQGIGVTADPVAASVPVENLLAEVARIAGVKPEMLKRGVMGRRGNPARRFAVWALKQSTFLTQKQIGQVLGMSESHVSRDLGRARTNMQEWIEAWEEVFPEKVSSVRV